MVPNRSGNFSALPHLGKASELIFIRALTAYLQTAVWPPAQADTPTPAAGTPSQASQAAPPSAWQTIESDAQDILTRQYLTGNWLGARDTLGNRGITPNVTFIQAVSGDAFGGLSTSKVDWRYRLDATLTLDMQKLCGWKGGTAYVDFLNHGGQRTRRIISWASFRPSVPLINLPIPDWINFGLSKLCCTKK